MQFLHSKQNFISSITVERAISHPIAAMTHRGLVVAYRGGYQWVSGWEITGIQYQLISQATNLVEAVRNYNCGILE